MLGRNTTWLARLGLGAALLLSAAQAVAQTSSEAVAKESEEDIGLACLKSHERSQQLDFAGDLLQAREALRDCSKPACPDLVRADCLEWLVNLQRKVPSLVFSTRSSRGPEPGARVYLDGQLVPDAATGNAIEINPGPHDIRFELEGFAPQSQRVILPIGEKRRVIEAVFVSNEPEPPKPAPRTSPTTTSKTSRPVPVATYVFGGIALAAAGAGTYLGLTTLDEFDEAQNSCGPDCSEQRVDEIRRRGLLSDVFFGVGLVSAGLSAYFYFTRPARSEQAEPPAAARTPIDVRFQVGKSQATVDFASCF